jgi:hypothetical protein
VKASSIDNIDELRYELMHLGRNAASTDWIEAWMWGDQPAPFNYRVLGKLAVWPLYQAMSFLGVEPQRAFYDAYVVCSLAFLSTTILMLGWLMGEWARRIAPDRPAADRQVLAGLALALFALSAPILFFVKFPIHGTPNDLIGYTLMLLALHCLSRQRIMAFVAVSVIAVFCRETTLLMSFIFLLFHPQPILRKLPAALLPVAELVLFRELWPGSYDALRGGRENLRVPMESAGFVLLTFGPLWILGALDYADLRKLKPAPGDPLLRMLTASFPYALLLTLGIATLLASLWEMRIVFMLFFYFIPFSVIAIHNRRRNIVALFRNKYVLLFIAASTAATFRFWIWMHPSDPGELVRRAQQFDFIFYGYINSPQHNWINVLTVYVFLFLASLPILTVPADSLAPPAPNQA